MTDDITTTADVSVTVTFPPDTEYCRVYLTPAGADGPYMSFDLVLGPRVWPSWWNRLWQRVFLGFRWVSWSRL